MARSIPKYLLTRYTPGRSLADTFWQTLNLNLPISMSYWDAFGIFWDTQRLRKCLICKFAHGLSHQLGNQDVDGSWGNLWPHMEFPSRDEYKQKTHHLNQCMVWSSRLPHVVICCDGNPTFRFFHQRWTCKLHQNSLAVANLWSVCWSVEVFRGNFPSFSHVSFSFFPLLCIIFVFFSREPAKWNTQIWPGLHGGTNRQAKDMWFVVSGTLNYKSDRHLAEIQWGFNDQKM